MTRVALKSLAARPLRTALTTLAIVLGVALVTGALTLTDTQRKAADSLSSASYDGTDAVVTKRTAFQIDSAEDWAVERPTIDRSVVDQVRSVPGVEVAVGDITDQNARIIGKDGKPRGDGPYFGVGLDARAPGVERVTPFELRDGRWARGPGEVVIDASTSDDEKYAVGDRVQIAARGKARSYEVVGVANFGSVKSLGPATAAIFDLEVARTLFAKGDAYDSILVAGREGADGAAVRRAVDAALPGSAQVQTAAAHDRFTFDGLEAFISIIRTVLLIFGGIAVLVGALTIFNSLSITIAQRTKELGMLRLAGADRAQVLRTVLFEALLIGIVGSLAGLGVGYVLAIGLQSFFASLGLDLPEAGTVFAAQTVVVAMIVGTLVTVVAGMIPALRATRVSPIDALRESEPGAKRGRFMGRVLAPLVSLLGRPAERIGGAAGMLARRNAMRQPGRVASTAAALTVGVALVTVIAVLAAGLRDTTRGTLERQVQATHVITGEDGWSPTDPAIERQLSGLPGVRAVEGVKMDTALAFGDHERVNAVASGENGRLLSFDYDDGAATDASALGRDGAIVDSGWASEHGLEVGERFAITSAAGTKLDLVVRGIERSPILGGMDLGPITISHAAYEPAFRSERNNLLLVDAADGAAIRQALAAFPDAKGHTKEAFITERTKDIDTLMAIFAVLLALAVIVSLFGIANALVLATFERRRELGMLAAVGMTRRQIRRMVRHESIVTALLGALTGVVVGLGLAALVTSALSDQGLTYAIPVGSIVVLGIVAVIAGILAAVLPARRASRLSPLSALSYE